MAEWRIEALADHHERGAFSCGKTPLDVFLRTQASQYARKGTGRTYVAVAPDSARVVGYYTVSASSVAFEHVPRAVAKKLPKHPVPTILLGRLAIDAAAQGQGLDTLLLMDATSRALGIAEQLGVFAVHAHAIDDDAHGWYARFGFQSLLDQERHMMLPIETIRKGFSKA